MAAKLAAEHRVIRVDLLGHGCTSAATELDAAAQARAMSGVLQRLGTSAATVVGHSFGADVVLAMARRTDQVARLVVIGQAPDYDCSRIPSIAFLPVLAILGGRDRLYPSTTTAARYRAAGARVVVIDDAGHSVNVQRPAEVAELIRDFVRHR